MSVPQLINLYQVYTCGEGSKGRLGLGHNNNVSVPQLINLYQVYTCGEGSKGRLGLGQQQCVCTSANQSVPGLHVW